VTNLRVGVVGLGVMGRRHAEAIARVPEVSYAGAADHTPRNDVLGSQVYGSVDALMASGLDACVIATPTPEHVSTTLTLVEAGVHVLIEKPLALDAEECGRIESAVARAGVVAAVGHVERFHSSVAALAVRLGGGELGPIESIRTRREGGPPRHDEGGILLDLGTHDFDLAMWLTGQTYERVSTARLADLPSDAAALVSGSLSGGVGVEHRLSWRSAERVRDVTVQCGGETLVADTREPGAQDPLQAQLRAFAELVSGSVEQTSLASVADGRRAVEVAVSAAQTL